MSMGYGANYADVVTPNFVKKMCPKEYAAFRKALKAYGSDLDDFAQAANFEDDPEGKLWDELSERWKALCGAFYAATMDDSRGTGLCLDICYHDKTEDGDRYDEVDGAFFTVGGVYELTPSGKKFGKQIKRKFYVTFG